MTSWTPARASASAHAATVAPVVRTSSTTMTRLRDTTRPADRLERPAHGRASFDSGAPRLRGGRHGSVHEPRDRQTQPAADRPRQRPRLVVSPLGQPVPRERYPCDGVCGRRADRDHGVGERGRDAPPPRELQPMDRRARRPGVQERRTSEPHGRRRAVPATIDRHRPGTAAPLAPGRTERFERTAARVTERPGTVSAPRAPRREDDVERPAEHDATLAGTTDISRPSGPVALRQIQLDRCGKAADVDLQP